MNDGDSELELFHLFERFAQGDSARIGDEIKIGGELLSGQIEDRKNPSLQFAQPLQGQPSPVQLGNDMDQDDLIGRVVTSMASLDWAYEIPLIPPLELAERDIGNGRDVRCAEGEFWGLSGSIAIHGKSSSAEHQAAPSCCAIE